MHRLPTVTANNPDLDRSFGALYTLYSPDSELKCATARMLVPLGCKPSSEVNQ